MKGTARSFYDHDIEKKRRRILPQWQGVKQVGNKCMRHKPDLLGIPQDQSYGHILAFGLANLGSWGKD